MDTGVVVLEIAVLEEYFIVVLMRFNAILAEGISTLVTRALNLFALVPRLLTVRDTLARLHRWRRFYAITGAWSGLVLRLLLGLGHRLCCHVFVILLDLLT